MRRFLGVLALALAGCASDPSVVGGTPASVVVRAPLGGVPVLFATAQGWCGYYRRNAELVGYWQTGGWASGVDLTGNFRCVDKP
jgi:hypothetical protein